MDQDKYTESDKKCCQWLDEIMNEKFTKLEDRELLLCIKMLLMEFPEELESIRGKYLAFVKDESNKYHLYEYVFNNSLDATDYGLTGAYLFFVPTEHSYCSRAILPHRNAIDCQSKKYSCIIS